MNSLDLTTNLQGTKSDKNKSKNTTRMESSKALQNK